MEKNYWKTIKPELIKYGFDIDDYFLDNISLKTNIEYIKEKIFRSPTLIYDFNDSLKNSSKIMIKKCNSSGEEINHFELDIFLGKGSYNNVYKIKDILNKMNYTFRFSIIKINKIKFLIDNYIETFIHAFFSIYQKIYLLTDTTNINNILKLKHFGYDPTNNSINTISDFMEGTLYDILAIQEIPLNLKKKILLKALIQITCLLENIQDNFKFVHNDLKLNNIFYKIIDVNKSDKYCLDNIHFFIGDFGSSRFELNEKLIISNEDLAKDTSFNSRKDLFLLINSLYFIFNDNFWMNNFFNKFSLDPKIPNNNENLVKLYYLDEKDIDTIFKPSNFKIFLNEQFNVSIDYSNDVILTVFGAKYKIKYNSN